jgi:hypothetical protein
MAGRILEAKAVISAEDRGLLTLLDRVSKKIDQVGKAGKNAKGIDAVAKSLQNFEAQAKAVERFKLQQGLFTDARARFNQLKINVDQAAKALSQASKPTKELEQNLKRAQTAVSSAAKAFERQKGSFLDAKRALEGFGIPLNKIVSAESRLKASIESTNAALKKQMALQERRAHRRDSIGLAAGAVGVTAAYRGRQVAGQAIESAADFDIGVRKQRAFTDLSPVDQNELLLPQAKRIGQETQFSNLDVIKAQTASMQGLPSDFSSRLKAEVAQGILENVKNYAMVMEADLETSAEAIRSYLQATGKDISTKEKALAEANKATNQLVKMAKLGGMSDEDVQQYVKYAASSGTTAGLFPETLMSLAALARRGGLRGDEAGTFIRSASSKLVSPTKKGKAALTAAGIDFDQYVRMPTKLESGRLENQFQNDIGKSFTPAVRKQLDRLLADPKVINDQGKFTEAVTKAVSPLFGRTRKGKMAAADQQKIARTASTFFNASVGSVDTERLLDDIMNSGMSLAQVNAMFTDKHGGKAAITQRQWDEFKTARQQLGSAADDPNFAKSKADEIMGGLGGEYENMKGSIENVILSLGQANESLLRFSFDGIGNALDQFSQLSSTTQQIVSIIGGGLAVGGGAYGAVKIAGGILGVGGPAGALTGSAAALTEAAGALNIAAVRLGAGGAAGSVAGAASTVGGGAAAAASRSFFWGLPRLAGYAGLAYGAYEGATFLGEGLNATGEIAAGKYWQPQSHPEVEALQGELSEIQKQIEGISSRIHPSMRDNANPELDRLNAKAADLRNRIDAWGGDVPGASGGSSLPTFAQMPTGGGLNLDSIPVTGEATVSFQPAEVRVTFDTNLFRSEVINIATQAAQKIQLRNGPGSTGTSSPDASQ